MNHKLIKFLWISILIIITCTNFVLAEKPDYNIIISLEKKSVDVNQKFSFSVDIIGNGICLDGGIQIIPEGKIDVTNVSLFNANSINSTDLNQLLIKSVSSWADPACLLTDKSLSESKNLLYHFENFTDTTSGEINTFKILGELIVLGDTEGGDYDVNTIFLCKSENETWHSFRNQNHFHVKYWLEDLQYSTASLAIFISFFAVLLTLIKDFFIPAIFKPNLKVEAKNDDECIETVSKNSRYLRIRLVNSCGFFSRKAEQCYIKLLEIRDKNKLRIYPFTPFPLKWSLYDNSEVDSRMHDLAKGEYHLIDLAHEYNGKRYFLIQGPLSHQLLCEAEKKLGPGKYTLKVGVYGSNFKPVFEEFRIELGDSFGKLRFI